jgi:cellulose synthase/poly-beta-1,6-N-acetylglucosamine synthase-like glycosyltransferase
MAYYLYLLYTSKKPWQLAINEKHSPGISIIIPARNEEKVIGLKLINLNRVIYPKDKIQVILIDDASTDKTVEKVYEFAKNHSELDLEVISGKTRVGKSAGLNIALSKVKNDIVIVSDADTFWSNDILIRALPFLSDPSIGAVSGRQILMGSEQSLLTGTEKVYLDLTYGVIKLGESKIHSTVIFHGLFSAYKKRFLSAFNMETDDSGTALDIVQQGARTIYVPGAQCYELPPLTWRGKIGTKVRRATQLVGIYARCFELLFRRRLKLPLRIALPEIFIYLVNPILFVPLLTFVALFFFFQPFLFVYALGALVVLLVLSSKFRLIVAEALQDYCILFVAVFTYALGWRFVTWNTLDESRSMVNEEFLKKANLV